MSCITCLNFVVSQKPVHTLPSAVQIVALLLLNATISFVEESNADKAIKALAGALAPRCKVWTAS